MFFEQFLRALCYSALGRRWLFRISSPCEIMPSPTLRHWSAFACNPFRFASSRSDYLRSLISLTPSLLAVSLTVCCAAASLWLRSFGAQLLTVSYSHIASLQ